VREGGLVPLASRAVRIRSVVLIALAAALLCAATAAGAVERHWLAPVAITPPGQVVGVPALAVDGPGAGVLTWTQPALAEAVMVAARPGPGAPWSSAVRLNGPCAQPPCVLGPPVADIDDAGDAAIAWTGFTSPGVVAVQVADRDAGSDAWSPAQTLATFPQAQTIGPLIDVGVDDAGAATVAWLGADGAVFAATRPAGGAWSDPVALAGPGGSNLDLAVGGGGTAVAVWISGCRPFAARRPAGGAWQAAIPLDADGACAEVPGAAVDATGNAVAAWRRWTGTGRVLRVADLGAGDAAWGSQQDLGAAGRTAAYIEPPVVSVTRQGGAVALWRDDANAVRLAERAPGGAWSAATPVPGLTGTLGDVAGDVAPDGTVALFQASFTDFPRALVRDPAGVWTAPIVIATAPPELTAFAAASIRLDDAGDAVVSSLDPGTARNISVTELTTRDGPRPQAPVPAVTGVKAPVKTPAGTVAHLQVTLDHPAELLPLTVERRSGARWIAVGRGSVSDDVRADVPVRLTRPGTAILRVRWTGPTGAPAASAPVFVTVTRPALPRVPAGPAPRAVAAGEGALWVLGADGGGATVRRIDPLTGRQTGPTIQVGGNATAIAAGAGAVWVVRYRSTFDSTTELLRIDPNGRVGTPTPLPGDVQSVTAGPAGVWVGGVCLPQPEPPGCLQQAAARIDPATGALTAARAVPSGGQAERVQLIGSTLWTWGRETGSSDDTVLGRANSLTGAVASSTTFFGHFGVPLVPVSAGAVWRFDLRSIATAYPRNGNELYATRGYPTFSAVPAGRLVWVLQSTPIRGRGADNRLVALDVRSGAPVGRAVELGSSAAQNQSLAVSAGRVWILRPSEGALIRIPTSRALRARGSR